ncbi:hypothetical protein W911_14265 [Hyphomicrobium nitrativorans NL23]|uniref:Uncharacterized protein n=1 Tax=Hyphomicrobium nitrativorans NL23 TaxID=1029756 RepID=V5SIK6_9HYPH|nr:hypothetical protein [Hyphomicrobium nitrativorans]AHB50312.1 hypothetical protein W911_14265 [Hyphomicrobium nitrativorans NL23]
MITILTSLFGLASWGGGLLGLAGVALKVLGKFAPGAASTILSNPITAAAGKIAEGFVDLVVWAIKATLTYLGTRIASALDHIFSNGFAGVFFLASIILAYEVGGWGRPSPQAAHVSPPVTRSAPATPAPKTSAPQSSTDPFDWIAKHFR